MFTKSGQREQCEKVDTIFYLSSEKVDLIVTDGAPVERSAVQTEALSLSCHAWSALPPPLAFCTRVSGELHEVMDRVMRDINSVRATSNISVGVLLFSKRTPTLVSLMLSQSKEV